MHLSSISSQIEISEPSISKDLVFFSEKKNDLIHYEHGSQSPNSSLSFSPIISDYFISSIDTSEKTFCNPSNIFKDCLLNRSTNSPENTVYNTECKFDNLINYKNDISFFPNSSSSLENDLIYSPLVSNQSESLNYFFPFNNSDVLSDSNHSSSFSSTASSLYFTNKENVYLENYSYYTSKLQCECTSKNQIENFTTPIEYNLSTILNSKNCYEMKIDDCKCFSSDLINFKKDQKIEQNKIIEQIRKNNEICHILSPFRKYRVCFNFFLL